MYKQKLNQMAQKVTMTYGSLLELVKSLNTVHSEKGSKREAKLKKIVDKIKPIFEEYNEKREFLRLDNAYANENDILEFNDKGEYKFTKDGIKKMGIDLKELLNETFEFYQFTFSNEGIEDLLFLEGWVEGIVQKEEEDEQIQ